MRVEILRPENNERYDQYLIRQESSLFYFSSKYKNFLKALLGCEEQYLVAIAGADIRGVLPLMYFQGNKGRIYNSLPYYGSNGGITADNPVAYHELVGTYNEIALSQETISSTIVTNPLAEHCYPDLVYNFRDYRISQITCLSAKDSHERLMARIESSARRNVKKAISAGVIVEVDHSAADRLGQLHQENIRAIGGIPKTEDFFRMVPRYFKPQEEFDIYVAKKDGRVIAALLLFYFNKTVEYFTPAIDNAYRSLQPLSMILLTALTHASRKGFYWWNWGGTWESQIGLYRFKRKWAAQERKYSYYTQLNAWSILEWNQADILGTFPNFFVVPFSSLTAGGGVDGQ
jgi:hypothetical protein